MTDIQNIKQLAQTLDSRNLFLAKQMCLNEKIPFYKVFSKELYLLYQKDKILGNTNSRFGKWLQGYFNKRHYYFNTYEFRIPKEIYNLNVEYLVIQQPNYLEFNYNNTRVWKDTLHTLHIHDTEIGHKSFYNFRFIHLEKLENLVVYNNQCRRISLDENILPVNIVSFYIEGKYEIQLWNMNFLKYPKLTSFYLHSPIDKIPESLYQSQTLKFLALNVNEISDEICHLKKLIWLDVSNSVKMLKLPKTLHKLPDLRKIYLRNEVHIEIPESLLNTPVKIVVNDVFQNSILPKNLQKFNEAGQIYWKPYY